MGSVVAKKQSIYAILDAYDTARQHTDKAYAKGDLTEQQYEACVSTANLAFYTAVQACAKLCEQWYGTMPASEVLYNAATLVYNERLDVINRTDLKNHNFQQEDSEE